MEADRLERRYNVAVGRLLSEESCSFVGLALELKLDANLLTTYLREEVVRRCCLQKQHFNYLNNKNGARIAQWDKETLRKACQRMSIGVNSIIAPQGRPLVLNPLSLEKLKNENDISKVVGMQASTKYDLEKQINRMRQEQSGLNENAVLRPLDC